MLATGWGRVVTIISDAARTGDQHMAAYAAAKAGAAGFMRSLATEAGPSGVTANCVSLGTLWRSPDPPGEDLLRRMARRYPMGVPGVRRGPVDHRPGVPAQRRLLVRVVTRPRVRAC
jgi:3-oxoacyl-[acyl-carrier protein] reductase